jgi:Homing endonuclease associated repeat
MSKNEILKAIQRCAKKLQRNPTFHDLHVMAGVSRYILCDRWGSLRKALSAAGFAATGHGFPQTDSALLLDWAAVARKLGKIPSVLEYERTGRFSNAPFHTRYRHWARIPEAFIKFARETKAAQDWQDVLNMIALNPGKATKKGRYRPSRKSTVMRNRPIIYGTPLPLPELMHEPMSEAGVIFAFGVLARRQGFAVRRIQNAFPDCEAMREVARGQWQPTRIEFELESRNFLLHKHDPKGCDVIVCWVHNWPECPLEVIELSKVAREFAADYADRRR